jgi:hypothetical protein
MSWYNRLPVTDNVIDRGHLHLGGTTIDKKRFDCCGLSLSHSKRSSFTDCVFSNLRFHRCSMGTPVFERCHFENVWVSDGPSAHGGLFLECKFRGTIRGINFGFSDQGGLHADSMIKENLRRAASAPYCLDLSEATCTSLGFAPGILAEKIRFRERQCLVLSAKKLHEIVKVLFGATKDKHFHLLLVCCMQASPCDRAITLVEQEAESQLEEYIAAMVHAGIEVRTSPLC